MNFNKYDIYRYFRENGSHCTITDGSGYLSNPDYTDNLAMPGCPRKCINTAIKLHKDLHAYINFKIELLGKDKLYRFN